VARKNEIDMAEQLGLSFDTDASTSTLSKVDETPKPEVDDGEQT
jgi:capsid protein